MNEKLQQLLDIIKEVIESRENINLKDPDTVKGLLNEVMEKNEAMGLGAPPQIIASIFIRVTTLALLKKEHEMLPKKPGCIVGNCDDCTICDLKINKNGPMLWN